MSLSQAPGRLLTLSECAERTSTTLRWWRRAVFERRVPVVHLGRLVRVNEADLERFIEANRRPAREEPKILESIEPRVNGARQTTGGRSRGSGAS